MVSIEESVDVGVDVHTAYDQWTQFEVFPQFMAGVKEVRQVDARHMHWVAEVAGRTKEWDAVITARHPDQAIAWEATDGTPNSGAVTFESLGPDRCRVNVTMGFDTDGVVEAVGGAVGVAQRRVRRDLERFRDFVEQGSASEGWSGTIIDSGQAESPRPT